MTDLYHLWSQSDSPAHEDEQWLRTVAPSLGRCSGCGLFRTDRAVDVPLREPLDGSALNFFWGTGLGVAAVGLLEAIGTEVVFKNLRLGRVLSETGRELPDVRVFRPVSTVTIRGGPTSKVRRCDVCGEILYAAVKNHHLVGSANEFKGLVGANSGGSLIADESIVNRLSTARFKNLGVTKIKVLTRPLDGYPIDLEQAVPMVARDG